MANFKVLVFLIFICTVFSTLEALADGNYRIRCNTRIGRGNLSIEAFVKSRKIRPRPDSQNPDQKWTVVNVENGKYKIYSSTKNGGKRFIEAYPKAGLVRPSFESKSQDQLWNIIPFDNQFYRISCNTKNRGLKSMEAFPNSDVIKVKNNSDDQDQKFEFIPWE